MTAAGGDAVARIWFDDFDDANDGNGWHYEVVGYLGVRLATDRCSSKDGAIRQAQRLAPDATITEGVQPASLA